MTTNLHPLFASIVSGFAPELREPIPAHRPGNSTQLEAAKAIAPKAGALREQIYQAIAASQDGMTNEEICDALGLKIQTVCARVNELQGSRGLPARIKWYGDYRKTSSGCRAKLWRAV